MSEDKIENLQRIIDSIQHPFYVIDINNYKVRFANNACCFGELGKDSKCHQLTHKSAVPCVGPHICPLTEVRKTKVTVKTEHVHFDKNGNPRLMEVHGDPIFDEQGNLVMMIEYAFDITEREEAKKDMQQKFQDIEKFNKLMLGRESRVIELKQEVNDLLKSLGKSPKYLGE